mgnify:CR=1 FL=1
MVCFFMEILLGDLGHAKVRERKVSLSFFAGDQWSPLLSWRVVDGADPYKINSKYNQ